MSGEIGNIPGYEQKPEIKSQDTTTPKDESGKSSDAPKTENADVKPTIFAGMTKEQAKEQGVMNIFRKIDRNTYGKKDGVITQDEINAYLATKQDNSFDVITLEPKTEDSSTEPAALSNEANVIKPEENIPIDENPVVEEEYSEVKDTVADTQAKETPKLFTGMTLEQAKELGVEDLFNQYSKNGQPLTKQDFYLYRKSTASEEINTKIEKLEELKAKAEAGDIEAKKELHKFYQETVQHYEDIDLLTEKDKEFLRGKTLTDCIHQDEYEEFLNSDEYNKSADKEQALDNWLQKKGAEFLREVKAKYLNDEKQINKQLERLEKGELTQFEIEQLGLSKEVIEKLSDDQKEYYAKAAVRRKAEAYLCEVLQNTVEKQIDENGKPIRDKQLEAVIRGFNGEAELDPEIKQVLIASGLFHMGKSPRKGRLQKHIAENTESYHILDKNTPETSYLAVSEIITGLDKETLENFIKNNSEHSDVIYPAVQNYTNRLPDTDSRKTELNNIIENLPPECKPEKILIKIINNSVSETPKETSPQKTPTSQTFLNKQVEQPNQQEYTTSPVEDTPKTRQQREAEEVALTRAEARKFYNSENILEKGISKTASSQGVTSPMNKKHSHRRAHGIMLENIPPAKIEEFAEKFNKNNIPPKFRRRIINKFSRMNNDRLAEMYFEGGNNTRAFLTGEKIIKPLKLCEYMNSHPDVIKDAPDEMKSLYESWQKSLLPYEKKDNFHSPLKHS